MKCDNCKHDYPMDLLERFQAGKLLDDEEDTIVEHCCGICALALSNKVTGLDRKQLNGPNAEKLRQAALRWREDHQQGGS